MSNKNHLIVPYSSGGINLSAHEYSDGEFIWSVAKLVESTKDLKIFKLPLAGINLKTCPWGQNITLIEFVGHMKRVEDADLSYPIILDSEGIIADGWHRIAKAILKGKTHIKAVRLKSMPPIDRKCE